MGNALHETSNLVKCIFLVLWPYRHQITYLISQSWTWFLFSLLRTSNRRRREFSNYSRKITGDTGVLLNLLLVHCHGSEFKKKTQMWSAVFLFYSHLPFCFHSRANWLHNLSLKRNSPVRSAMKSSEIRSSSHAATASAKNVCRCGGRRRTPKPAHSAWRYPHQLTHLLV